MSRLLTIIIALSSVYQIAGADVVVKYKSKAEITNRILLKTESAYYIKGDKNYSELKTNFSAPKESGTPFDIISKGITRLDRGIHWSLLSSKYSEETIASMHDSIGQAGEYNWTFNVTPISDKDKIKKFTCFGQIGKAVGVGINDPADTVYLTFEQWSTDDTSSGRELMSYEDSFTKASAIHKMWSQEHIATYLEKGYGAQFEKLSDLMGERRGISIKSFFQIERTILYDEASNRKGTGKHPKDGGNWKLFSMTNELVSIEDKKIDSDKFEIPANYEKK